MDGLNKDLLSRSRVIAKGRRIRDVARLVEQYGGVASEWVKKSSPPFPVDSGIYEYHWYECHGIGRFEIKLKKVSQP
jgi:hypothetical protein